MNKPGGIPAPPTSASLLTPPGRGAVASVRFEGDCALIDGTDPPLFKAADGRPLARQEIGRIVFGWWGDETREDVVVCRTSESVIEIHCHGGNAAIERILADLESLDCRIETWQALATRTHGVLETECLECLTRAVTARTAAILLEQQSGILKSALEGLLAAASSEQGVPSKPIRTDILARIEKLLAWSDFGIHLSVPWTVTLLGRPNVGKSSLMNALLGYSRSIVFDQPGTTRDVLKAETAFDGWPLHLVDTAGLREEADELEAAGITLAKSEIERSDCRMLLLDIGAAPAAEDHMLLEQWPDAIIVAHKCDLPDVWGDALPVAAVRVSSVSGAGLTELAQVLVDKLMPQVPPPGTAMPITRRQAACVEKARAAAQRDDWSAFRETIEECLGQS